MSRNIKEIGKELLGKSLNSFHRKTGLTQLEKNNEMQDGILDGILSQVDDAYIEKTDQSNVIHLDGSGDGVVVLDSIEGNTMVNLLNFNDIGKAPNYNCLNINSDKKSLSINTNLEFDNRYQYFRVSSITLHSNKEYTFVCNITKNTFSKTFEIVPYSSRHTNRKGTNGDGSHYLKVGQTGIHKYTFTMVENDIFHIMYADSNAHFDSGEVEIINPMILEGDWSDKEIPASYFEGLQSSFEEKVNEQGKYEIEILSKNKNIDEGVEVYGYYYSYIDGCKASNGDVNSHISTVEPNTQYYATNVHSNITFWDKDFRFISGVAISNHFTTPSNCKFVRYAVTKSLSGKVQLEKGNTPTEYVLPKSNKIKLLLDEPLRSVGDVKDRLCIKDNRLVVERNFVQVIVNGENLQNYGNFAYKTLFDFKCNALYNWHLANFITDSRFKNSFTDYQWNNRNEESIAVSPDREGSCIDIIDKSIPFSVNSYKEHLKENPIKVVCQLLEPYYEEVVNEHGEPILLEGYENGTIYIDSTIVPTTSVRYTPKMESFKTLNEISDNNTMLTNDINDNIIPYLMDVDLMIMEKEMALMSQYKIRRMGAKDMTSMQKRTQDMLERLIKGKTLTEQECKTRITTYLNAGKITDAQAEELNFLIDEIYA